jgi:ribosome-binding factor A
MQAAGSRRQNVLVFSCLLPTAYCLLPTVFAMHRPERIAETLREEIAQIVGYELEDPRLTLVTVTEVRVADDLRDASVYVTVQGDEKEHLTAMRALQHAAPYVRKQLGFALNLRHTPALHFVRDTVEEKAERVSSLLEKIEPVSERIKDAE